MEEGAEGVSAVGELPFLVAGEFGEREAEGRDEEERIIAEPVGAARGVQDFA